MKTPLVSIIIPTYNRAHLIGETLDSVLAQTYTNWECIVVDDGSTDDTDTLLAEYCKRDNRFQYHHRPKGRPKGANSCRNYGFELSKGEYVNWFDSDDFMDIKFIIEKVKLFSVEIVGVVHRNKYANNELTRFRLGKYDYADSDNLFYSYVLEKIELQTCSFLWRSSYLVDKRLFDESVDRYQDNEFHIRILAKKPKIKITEKILAIIKGGNGEKTQISSNKNISSKKMFDIFNFRFKTLNLSSILKDEEKIVVNKILPKKTIWAFYGFLNSEKSFIKRVQAFLNNYDKLIFIYRLNAFSFFDIIKSHLFIFKVLLYRKETI